MTSWTLILFMYAGVLSSGDSVALTQISGFTNKTACEASGKAASALVKASFKEARFTCVEVK